MCSGVVRDDLDFELRWTPGLEQEVELFAHGLGSADDASDRALADDCQQAGLAVVQQSRLSLRSDLDLPVAFFAGEFGIQRFDDRGRVGLRLKQTWNELCFEGPDLHSC